MMGYYLLDNHKPTRKPWYTTRRKPTRLIVIHTGEIAPDVTGPDTGAERLAAYGATVTDKSWHATIDSDSGISMLPDSYTAWHVRGYNSESLGVEIATEAAAWNRVPPDWKNAVMERLAALVGFWCDEHDIPRKILTKAQVDAGQKGIVGHHLLDPGRRSDPGKGFDWSLLLELLQTQGAPMPPTQVPSYAIPSVEKAIATGFLSRGTELEPVPRFDLMVFLDRLGAFDDLDLDESDDITAINLQLKAIKATIAAGAIPTLGGLKRGDTVTLG